MVSAAVMLQQPAADARADGSRALQEAAAGGFAPVVLALLVAGAQPGVRNGLALRRAAAGNHTAVVQVLQAAASRDMSVPGIASSASPPSSSSASLSLAGNQQGRVLGTGAAAATGRAVGGTSPPKRAGGSGGVVAAVANGRTNSGGWSSVAAAALPPAAVASASRRSGNGLTTPRPSGVASMLNVHSITAPAGIAGCWPHAGPSVCAYVASSATEKAVAAPPPPSGARHASQPHSPVCTVAGAADARSLFASMIFGGIATSGAAAAQMAVGGQSV